MFGEHINVLACDRRVFFFESNFFYHKILCSLPIDNLLKHKKPDRDLNSDRADRPHTLID